MNDKISQLPDEVLGAILSLLPMKEAARTSVLSDRWRNLWTLIPNLHFDALDFLDSRRQLKEHLRIRARKTYIDWVNSVLKTYQGTTTTIHEFCIRFDLDAHNTRDINSWVKFASEKKVESLTMHFPPVYSIFFRRHNQYALPAFCKLFSYYTSLKKLVLKFVDIGENFIHHLISSCPRLEELAIEASRSQQLVNLNIDGPSLCLKHLKIVLCPCVKSMYLSASNILSFRYEGHVIDINYGNIPNLVDVSLGYGYFYYIVCNFPRLSNYVMRLEKLTLHTRGRDNIKEQMAPGEYPQLPFLRSLKLDVYKDDYTIGFLASLVNAAPSLQKLELQMYCNDPLLWRGRRVGTIPKELHRCLKEVEVVGFVGECIDMEYVMYVLKIAIALERVTLDHMSPWDRDKMFSLHDCPFKCPLTLDHMSPRDKALGLDCPLNCPRRAMKQAKRRFAMKQAKRLKSDFSLGEKLVFL